VGASTIDIPPSAVARVAAGPCWLPRPRPAAGRSDDLATVATVPGTRPAFPRVAMTGRLLLRVAALQLACSTEPVAPQDSAACASSAPDPHSGSHSDGRRQLRFRVAEATAAETAEAGGLHLTPAPTGVLVTAVAAGLPAAAVGLGPGWTVVSAADGEKEQGGATAAAAAATLSASLAQGGRKALRALQRILAAAVATDGDGSAASLELLANAPAPIRGGVVAARAKRIKKKKKQDRKRYQLPATSPDLTADFHAAAQGLPTMGEAWRLLRDEGAAIDVDRPFVVSGAALGAHPSGGSSGGGGRRTSLLAHVLSLVSREVGLLGGVRLGLAPGTSRHLSPALAASGVNEALAVATRLANATARPATAPSLAGYPPIFYAVGWLAWGRDALAHIGCPPTDWYLPRTSTAPACGVFGVRGLICRACPWSSARLPACLPVGWGPRIPARCR
jgi:hypothetical protein